MKSEPLAIASIVLAGGQGKRLYPITLNHSKPAAPFGGRYRLIDIPLSNSINSEIRQIFVIAQFLTSELQHHLAETYHFDTFSPGAIEFLTPEEKPNGEKLWFDGTADAVRKNLHIILQAPVDYFLILSGDQLYNINFEEMFKFAVDTDSDLTIASLPVKGDEAKRLGLLKIDNKSMVTNFVEKPEEKEVLDRFKLPSAFYKTWDFKEDSEPGYLASMGIYIFKRDALKRILRDDDREDFGKHLIPKEIARGKTSAYVYKGYWEDIGTISSYYHANLALTKSDFGLNTYDEQNPIFARRTHLPGPKIKGTQISNSIISEGADIHATEISNSIIGVRAQIKKGSVIQDTIIMGSHYFFAPTHQEHRLPKTFGIGENCLIQKAIIDEHVLIGNNVKLTNEKNVQTMDGEGIFIRDGIIVITAGTHIPDNFTL